MKRCITLSFSIFNLLCFGFYPLWYWSARHQNFEGVLRKEGFYIYGFEIRFIGLCLTFGVRTFNRSLRINKHLFLIKNIEL